MEAGKRMRRKKSEGKKSQTLTSCVSLALAIDLRGYLQFAPGTHVDTTRSVGFVAGSTWCAAPVATGAAGAVPVSGKINGG